MNNLQSRHYKEVRRSNLVTIQNEYANCKTCFAALYSYQVAALRSQ